jgi:hypothetical protein
VVVRTLQELPLNMPSRLSFFLLAGLLLPVSVLAQDALPANLVSIEEARSRNCVPVLDLLATLEVELEPLAQRAQRLGALNQAVALEDRERVAPLDPTDPMEAAVGQWFERDRELAEAIAESGDEALQRERNRAREEIRTALRESFEAVNARAGERVQADGDLGILAGDCDGAVFVRSAVLEACGNSASPVCGEARNREEAGRFRFVERAEDLWDIEQLRPWADPAPLQPSPEGGLGGAQTGTLARRGNVTLVVSLETLIQDRSQVGADEAAEFDAHLEALGFEFDDPRFIMSPALAATLDLPGPLGGETHYLLHFGDLSDPPNQAFWALPVQEGGPIQALFPAPGWVLAHLAEGEEVRLTAIRLPEGAGLDDEDVDAQAIFTLELTSVGQARAVGTLLGYMASGDLASDLARLIPPDMP